MALVAHNKNGLLPAATLVEVLIALVLVMLAFGLGLTTYSTVLSSSGNEQRLQARMVLEEIMLHTKAQQLWVDQTVNHGQLRIEQTLAPYAGENDGLQTLTLTAYNQHDKQLAQCKALVHTQ